MEPPFVAILTSCRQLNLANSGKVERTACVEVELTQASSIDLGAYSDAARGENALPNAAVNIRRDQEAGNELARCGPPPAGRRPSASMAPVLAAANRDDTGWGDDGGSAFRLTTNARLRPSLCGNALVRPSWEFDLRRLCDA
jgi:hypothetical protein